MMSPVTRLFCDHAPVSNPFPLPLSMVYQHVRSKLKFEWTAAQGCVQLYLPGSRAVTLAYSANVQTEREEHVVLPSCQ